MDRVQHTIGKDTPNDTRYLGEEVAVKVFVPAVADITDAIAAFGAFKVESEKTMILSRRSKAILQVIEYGDAELPDGLPDELREFFLVHLLPFMITEKARFGSLDRVVKGQRALPGFDRVAQLECLANATEGIKEAHDHSVTHRDIKPQNILIFAPGQGKIADFGTARWRSRRANRESALLTPKYASPEQAFYAITGERRVVHPAVVAVRGAARGGLVVLPVVNCTRVMMPDKAVI